jgi:hypothetical protein
VAPHAPTQVRALHVHLVALAVLLQAVALLAVSAPLVLNGFIFLSFFFLTEFRFESVWISSNDLLLCLRDQVFVSYGVTARKAVTLGSAFPSVRKTFTVQFQTFGFSTVAWFEVKALF